MRLLKKVRLPLRSQPPQVAGNHVDELRELLLPVAQRLLDLLLIFDVYRHNRLLLPDKANFGTVSYTTRNQCLGWRNHTTV
jgi:hypothetical protein